MYPRAIDHAHCHEKHDICHKEKHQQLYHCPFYVFLLSIFIKLHVQCNAQARKNRIGRIKVMKLAKDFCTVDAVS